VDYQDRHRVGLTDAVMFRSFAVRIK